MPRFDAVNDRVLAAGTSPVGRTRGTIAPRVEEATANPAAWTATSPSSRGRLASPATAAASSAPVQPHRVSDDASSSRRRSTASATAPPQSPNSTSGTSPTTPSMPTQNEDPVSSYTCTGTATAVSWKPTKPRELPSHSRRKSGWRSGSTSIAARRSRLSGVMTRPAFPSGADRASALA
jgi:hypothetical protein